MAFSHGSTATMGIDPTNATTYTDVTSYFNDVSLKESIDTAETTVLGNTAKNYIPGLEDATFSLSGFFEPTLDGIVASCKRVIVSFRYRPNGAGTGKVEYTGHCILTSYKLDTSASDAASQEIEFQVTNGVTVAVQS